MESKFTEVGYYLEKNPESEDLFFLIRQEGLPDGALKEGESQQTLADNIKTMGFRYYTAKDQRWESKWDSTHMDTKNIFPDAVEISLTMVGPKKQEVSFTTIVQILLPNNEEKQNG